MQLNIKIRLFLLFFFCSLFCTGTILVLSGWSLVKGFDDYLESVDQELVDSAIKATTPHYNKEHGWFFLQHDPVLWTQIQQKAFNQLNKDEPARRVKSGEHNHNLALFDTERYTLIGEELPRNKLSFAEIHVDNNLVGYLGYLPSSLTLMESNQNFQRHQRYQFILIAFTTLAISIIIAILLTSTVSNPIRKISHATHQLAAGKLNVKINLNEARNDEIGHIAKDLNALSVALENNEKARNQWIADISHELRTPLAVLQAQLEALLDDVRETTPSQLKLLLNKTEEMNRLVDNLHQLSLSDLGAITYRKELVPLDDIIEEAVEAFSSSYNNAGVSLELKLRCPETPFVYADEKRLMQLFNNLLTNSLRYTDTGGKLVIDVQTVGKAISIQFNDTEPGVPEQDMARLFDRLYRVEPSRDRRSGGSGLGLSICKNIVSAHNGSISVSASPIGGLSVSILLPLEKDPTTTTNPKN